MPVNCLLPAPGSFLLLELVNMAILGLKLYQLTFF